jgi:hypothetical protein
MPDNLHPIGRQNESSNGHHLDRWPATGDFFGNLHSGEKYLKNQYSSSTGVVLKEIRLI